MSERAQIDVDALRSFIGSLQSFNSKLETDWGQLKSRWQASYDTWQDKKKDQFTESVGWDDVIRMMQGYLAKSQEYTNFLKKLEERASTYLET